MDAIELIPRLLRSGIEGDRKMLEATALMIVKKIRKQYPEVADEISHTLSYMGSSSAYTRSINLPPLPVDKESRFALANVEEPVDIPEPILTEYTSHQISDFIKERELISEFIQANITPPNSLLLSGQPGVGKTYIAHWISGQLNLPLVTLDLATSISSYLGRTGQNIRSIFDYAKSHPSVLFLDELDAIAKRRDDSGDLGELKRLVNVLLKEIEDYPITGIIIGATNHPELLDKAIWRRFDRAITVEMPEFPQRKQLLTRHLENYTEELDDDIIDFIATETNGINSADICKLCEHIKRQFILTPESPAKIVALTELFKVTTPQDKETKIKLCKNLKYSFPSLTQRDISQITRIPLTTVSRYLAKKERQDG